MRSELLDGVDRFDVDDNPGLLVGVRRTEWEPNAQAQSGPAGLWQAARTTSRTNSRPAQGVLLDDRLNHSKELLRNAPTTTSRGATTSSTARPTTRPRARQVRRQHTLSRVAVDTARQSAARRPCSSQRGCTAASPTVRGTVCRRCDGKDPPASAVVVAASAGAGGSRALDNGPPTQTCAGDADAGGSASERDASAATLLRGLFPCLLSSLRSLLLFFISFFFHV